MGLSLDEFASRYRTSHEALVASQTGGKIYPQFLWITLGKLLRFTETGVSEVVWLKNKHFKNEFI